MSHKDGRVVLSAWVDPVLRDHAREAARLSGLEFSRWVARAVRQTSHGIPIWSFRWVQPSGHSFDGASRRQTRHDGGNGVRPA